jgi:hypothetical protein
MTNMTRTFTARAVALLLSMTSLSQAAVIGTTPWTAVGASGTAVSGQITLTGQIAYLDSPSTMAVVIYNVVAVDGLQAKDGFLLTHPVMKARFRDNGANNRIIFRLKRMDLNSGAVQTLMTLDSDTYSGSSGFQTREIGCGNSVTFDFSNHAYFVEATMSRTSLPITPGIAGIQLGRSSSPCITSSL